MQSKKRKTLVVALIVSLIAILSLGSLAYFTAKDDVTNTIKFETEDNFKVEVFEHDWTKPNTDETSEGVTYTNIMPGQEFRKDPTVRNTGKHTEWVRVHVILPDGMTWMNIMAANGYEKVELSDFVKGYDKEKWSGGGNPVVGPAGLFSQEPIPLTWTFYLNEKLEPGAQETLFTSVVIPPELTNAQAASLGGQFEIKVEAEAVQAENMPANVTTAQQAFALIDG